MDLFDILFAKKLSGGGSPFPPVIKRVTGNPIEFTDGADAPLVKCVTEIQGSQDLHGYDKPWVGGAGKNKLPMTVSGIKALNTTGTWNGNTYTYRDVALTILTDSDDNVIGIDATGTASANLTHFIIAQNVTFSEAIIFSCGFVSTWNRDGYVCEITDGTTVYTPSEISGVEIPSGTYTARFAVKNSTSVNHQKLLPMIRLSTVTDPTFEPYSNICPITAYTEGEIEVSDGVNTTTHTTTYPSAIYRGSEDVVNGEVTSEWGSYTFTGNESWTLQSEDTRKGFSTAYLLREVAKLPVNNNYSVPVLSEIGNFDISYNTLQNYDFAFCIAADGRIGITRKVYDNISVLTGVTIYFELATPTTSSVTPTNLPIKSLSGYNHIESSTGEMEIDYITEGYQNFVDTVESALPNTRKGGVKAFDIFKTLDEPKKPEASAEESEPEEKETEEGAKK